VEWFGVSVPLAITIGSFVLGLIFMVLWWLRSPGFFRRRSDTSGGGPVEPSGPTTLHPAPGR
jgi:hypothetical protein